MEHLEEARSGSFDLTRAAATAGQSLPRVLSVPLGPKVGTHRLSRPPPPRRQVLAPMKGLSIKGYCGVEESGQPLAPR